MLFVISLLLPLFYFPGSLFTYRNHKLLTSPVFHFAHCVRKILTCELIHFHFLFTVMAQQQSLTQHLLSLNPTALREATQHPFLKQAATGILPVPAAISWLAQDRLYALSYVNFVSALLAKIRIPFSSERTSTSQWRTADALIECLVNIKNELQLFEDTAKSQGWSHIFDETRYAGKIKSSLSIDLKQIFLFVLEKFLSQIRTKGYCFQSPSHARANREICSSRIEDEKQTSSFSPLCSFSNIPTLSLLSQPRPKGHIIRLHLTSHTHLEQTGRSNDRVQGPIRQCCRTLL